MASKRNCVDTVHADRTDSPGATAWVVLLEETGRTKPDSGEAVPARLARHGFSVLRLQPSLHSSRRSVLAAVANGVAALGDEDPSRPFLFAGTGRLAPLAALAAIEHDAAGLLSVDGPLLSVSWRLHRLAGPALLLGTDAASSLTTGALRLSAAALGQQGRFARDGAGGFAGDRALRDWGTAVDRGAWPTPALNRSRRLALPAAAALLAAPTAIALTATPVGASQRSGDGVTVAKRTSSPERMLQANKVPKGNRQGDGGRLQPHATGSQALVDGAGMKWFINTDITFSTTSSASGAMSEASYTHAVPASTMNGGTTSSTLNDAYDGYNSLAVSVNGTVCNDTSQVTSGDCTWYNKNGAAATDCNGREILFPNQAINGLTVSRRNFVPADDHFDRLLNVFTNPTAAPITVTSSILNNLGSDSNTVITGSSSGSLTPTTADNWVTTFQNWSGTTSSDPRLGHVLEGPGATVPLSTVSFTNGDDNPFWGYTFTVAPGQTVIIANFGVADATQAASMADSARLMALPASALECMSAADKANLANFHVATGPTGFRLTDPNGGVYSFGAAFDGSLPGLHVVPNKPIVAMAATPDAKGYWLAGADGGTYAFGDATFGGSLPGLHVVPNKPVVAMAAASGGGYWMAGADGAVYALGGAQFYGSLPGLHVTPNQPIVGMAGTADGGGYWLVGADGAVYAFGDATFEGSLPGLHVTPNKPVMGIAPTASGKGYLLVGADGAVYAFGDATFKGSLPGLNVTPAKPIVGIVADASGKGYWLTGGDGGTFSFGDTMFLGSAVGLTSGLPIVGAAPGT